MYFTFYRYQYENYTPCSQMLHWKLFFQNLLEEGITISIISSIAVNFVTNSETKAKENIVIWLSNPMLFNKLKLFIEVELHFPFGCF